MHGAPLERPQVTLRGASGGEPSATPARDGQRVDGQRAAPVVLLLVLAVVAVLVRVDRPLPIAPVAARPPPEAGLELRAGDVAASGGGLLVLPVVLHNRGGLLRVRSVQVPAEPVRRTPTTTAPVTVGPGDSRGFLVLVEPDCTFLAMVHELSFRASLLVVVADRGAARQLTLDLAGAPAVGRVVAQLCGA